MHRLLVSELEVGQELVGVVNKVRPFGAFVDVGADRDGLVHISKITEGFVDKLEDFVKPGQEVKVWVTEVLEDGKLGLTMVQERGTDGHQDHSAELAGFEKMKPDEWITGTVQGIVDFGLYVSVSPPGGGLAAKGMVHISQIKEGFVEHPAEEVTIGQEVRVRVTEVNKEAGKMRLSMRDFKEGFDASGRPSEEQLASFEGANPSEWIEGTVHHLTPFGVFVEVNAPGGELVQGLVHVTQMRDGFVDHPSDEVEIGQTLSVRVVGVDPAAGRLSLSMKPEEIDEGPVDCA